MEPTLEPAWQESSAMRQRLPLAPRSKTQAQQKRLPHSQQQMFRVSASSSKQHYDRALQHNAKATGHATAKKSSNSAPCLSKYQNGSNSAVTNTHRFCGSSEQGCYHK